MLSRVADNLFWMSRYMERAGHVARLLETSFHLDLDLAGVGDGAHDLHWLCVLEILQQPQPESGSELAASICHALTFDLQNSQSIMCCVNRARNNARGIRGSLSMEMWRDLNKLYWLLTDADFRRQVRDSPHELYQEVQTGSQSFHGVCDATITHDEGWRFIQLGKFLERAGNTLRILTANCRRLQGLTDPSLSNVHWAGVLKTCQAYQAYQRMYISRVEAERVAQFLLFNAQFPISVRFCLEAAADHLEAIGAGQEDRVGERAARLLGRAISDLEYAEPDAESSSIRALLDVTWQRCTAASNAVQEQYALA